MKNIVDRFLSYTAFDTQSSETADTTPSTPNQKVFANALADELRSIGLADVAVSQQGYLTATVPANIDADVPVVGFIAHLDTSPDCSGANVRPQIVRYDGGDVRLNPNLTMKVADYPELLLYKGEDIIFTDGNTLLGADDKAGVAAIVSAAERLLNDDSIKHGKIRICFTPDDEIGQGADHFDVSGFNADFAYTLDGGRRGELEYESFNAAAATVTCRGISVHPGSALGKMKNAQLIAMDFYKRLPADEIPQMTSDRQGFFHITHVEGDVEKAVMNFIIRDFDIRDFENRKQLMSKIAADINSELDGDFVSVEIRDQYYNMRSCLEPVMYVVDYAREAIRSLGIETIEKPIRGGTDGARLSFMGLPTPNVFAGGENFHGRYEFLPVKSLEMASAVVVKIAEIVAQKGSK